MTKKEKEASDRIIAAFNETYNTKEMLNLKNMSLWQCVDIRKEATIMRVPNGWVLNQWFEEDVADGRGSRTHYTSTFIPLEL